MEKVARIGLLLCLVVLLAGGAGLFLSQTQNGGLTDRMARLDAELESRKAAETAAIVRTAKLDQDLSVATLRLKRLHAENTALAARMSRFDAQPPDCETPETEQLVHISDDVLTATSLLIRTQQIEKVDEERAAAAAAFEEQRAEIARLKQHIAELNAQIAEHDANAAAAEATTMHETIASATKLLEEQEAEIFRLTERNTNLTVQITEYEIEAAKTAAEMARLNQELASKVASLTERQAENASLTERVSSLDAQISNLEAKVAVAEAQSKKLNDDIKSKTSLLEEQRAQIAAGVKGKLSVQTAKHTPINIAGADRHPEDTFVRSHNKPLPDISLSPTAPHVGSVRDYGNDNQTVTRSSQESPIVQPKLAVPKVLPKLTTAITRRRAGWLVQLAARRSHESASSDWHRLVRKHANVLQGLRHMIVRADLGARGIFYRLRVGDFPTAQAAQQACALIKLRGGECFGVRRIELQSASPQRPTMH